jgi:phospholipid transport system substrate-binding protein
MKIFKHIIGFLLILPLITFGSTATTPDGFLKNSVREVSLFIADNKEQLDTDDTFLRDKMNDIVIPKLDIVFMSKLILGKKNWVSSSSNQKEQFQEAFKGLMVRTYMKSLSAFDGEKIKFLPYIPGKRANIAKVKSIYLLSEGELPVSYRLILNDSKGWRVFDIIIDGVSLLKNYRSDFRSHIESHGIDSLINELNSKE